MTRVKDVLVFTDVEDGDILMMASQEHVRREDNSERVPMVYDALEELVYGEITNTTLLRSVSDDGETWAFVFQKGTRNV